MLFRVVLQGTPAPGADLEQVKREFCRVTALPQNVTDTLFDGTPKVIKRDLAETDAERIAKTLRAIGAPATVEAETETHQKVPLGTPTVSPATSGQGSAELTAAADAEADLGRRRQHSRRRLLAILGGVAVVGVALLAAPFYDEWVRRIRGTTAAAPAPEKKAPAPASAPAAPPREINRAAIEGIWRCTNQSTGVSNFWRYDPDGTIEYHGENATYQDKATTAPDLPVRWALEGSRLTWTYEGKPAATMTVIELTQINFEFRNAGRDVLLCRR